MTHESKNASAKQSATKQNTKNGKSEAEKQAAREARDAKRAERMLAAADKAGAWESALGIVNKAGAHEKMRLLAAAVLLNDAEKIKQLKRSTKANKRLQDGLADARTYVVAAVQTLCTPDLRAVLAAVPDRVLAKAVRVDGSLKVSTIAREMAHEIAKNPQTALAVAQAAQDAQRKAARKARKAAKKAEKATQGKAGAK